jgi:hypothetical protein
MLPSLEWFYIPRLPEEHRLSDFKITLRVRIFEAEHKDELKESLTKIKVDELDTLIIDFTGIDRIIDYQLFYDCFFAQFKKIRHLKLIPSYIHEDMEILPWIPCWKTVESFERVIVHPFDERDFELYRQNTNLKALSLTITVYNDDPLTLKPYFLPNISSIEINGSISYSKELIEMIGSQEKIISLTIHGLLLSIDDPSAFNELLYKHRFSLLKLDLQDTLNMTKLPCLLALKELCMTSLFDRAKLKELLERTTQLRCIRSTFQVSTIFNVIRESGNGSVRQVNGTTIRENVYAHWMCQESSIMLFLTAYKKARFPKEMAKMMAEYLLNTKCDIQAWEKTKRAEKRIKL